MRILIFILLALLAGRLSAQVCNCEKELLYVKQVIENNFAGFDDKLAQITPAAYNRKVKQLIELAQGKFASDNCILIIDEYLSQFKSHHLGLRPGFNALVNDTPFISLRPLYELSEKKLEQIRNSHSWEGIYYFTHDSSYKIAVIKDKTPLHDYIGVLLESRLPLWRRGMIKFEGKLVNDSLMKGLLYMRNQRPKFEGFNLWNNNEMISGDWRREGTQKKTASFPHFASSPNVEGKALSGQTFYIRIRSFEADNRVLLDSVLAANEKVLQATPNLILDLRDNGGGSDYTWQSLIPYLYTSPIRTVGLNVLATKQNIDGWKKYLDDENLSPDGKQEIGAKVSEMEKAKARWVNIVPDQTDSSFEVRLFPKKVAILINRYCGSSTEEFLLAARQSSKVILIGENTIGNLDYSNVVETSFSCFPYTLMYATSRSRRIDGNMGIDNKGIAPKIYLKKDADWVKEAQRIVEGEPVSK